VCVNVIQPFKGPFFCGTFFIEFLVNGWGDGDLVVSGDFLAKIFGTKSRYWVQEVEMENMEWFGNVEFWVQNALIRCLGGVGGVGVGFEDQGLEKMGQGFPEVKWKC
jgi:hypothetical protein